MSAIGRGVVFPGQGSQRRGMALDFAERFAESRRVFDVASEALSLDVAAICRDEADPRLDLTEYTQPCILTAEFAMFEGLKAHFGLRADWFGGHSLGEYAALVAAGALPFRGAVRLVRERGRLMQAASRPGFGGMAAIIMEQLPTAEISAVAESFGVDVANDNSASQVVLSGELAAVERTSTALVARYEGQLRAVPLSVSAPFHSRFMAAAEEEYRERLLAECESWAPSAATRVTSNTTGGLHSGDEHALVDALASQLSGRVRWRDNMEELRVRTAALLEIGPNRPLGGFFKAIGVTVASIIDLRTAQRVLPAAPPAPAVPVAIAV